MARRNSFSEFGVVEPASVGGEWKVWIRTSPEDIEEYSLREGLPLIGRMINVWNRQAYSAQEQISELERTLNNLEEDLKEGSKALEPLVKAGVFEYEEELQELLGLDQE